jgi:hypothetical protein
MIFTRLENFIMDAIVDCEFRLGMTEIDDGVKELYSPEARLPKKVSNLSFENLKPIMQLTETAEQR